MVVVAGLLVVQPADHPDVEVGITVELQVDALAGIVANEVAPQRGRLPHLGREVDQLRAVEVAVAGDTLADEGPGRDHESSVIGLSRQRASTAASPKVRT